MHKLKPFVHTNTFDQKGACMYLELQDIKKSYGSGDTRTLVLK